MTLCISQPGVLVRLDVTEAYLRIIIEPTMTRAPPVAHEGIEAKMGAKNTETKNASPVIIAVIPVLPPSDHIMKSTARTPREREKVFTTDTSSALNVSSNGAGPHERTHADGEGVHAICEGGVLKVEGYGVAQASEFGHGVEGPGGS